jgi:hypothetical protein
VTDIVGQQIEALRHANKFAEEDGVFLARRAAFAQAIGRPDLYSYIDQFALYAGGQTLASRLAAYDTLCHAIDIPGHVVEFGVWHGANLMFLAKILKLLRPNSTKKVVGFDSFQGLHDFHAFDGADASAAEGKYRGNEATLRAAIELFGMQDWVHLIKGDARTTIPRFAEELPEFMVSYAWIDFDVYEPCKAALNFLSKRLAVGGIIVFDEALSAVWPGETRAMLEFLEDRANSRFDMFDMPIARQPVLYLVRR